MRGRGSYELGNYCNGKGRCSEESYKGGGKNTARRNNGLYKGSIKVEVIKEINRSFSTIVGSLNMMHLSALLLHYKKYKKTPYDATYHYKNDKLLGYKPVLFLTSLPKERGRLYSSLRSKKNVCYL